MGKFNLQSAIVAAEAGDAGQWEQIARRLLAAKKPRASKKAAGPQTWAHVFLEDGREFLTSAYAKVSADATIKVHGDSAQFRARMEDSGDRSDALGALQRAFLDPAIKPVPVRAVTLLGDGDIERVREQCFVQRAFRQGWIGEYRKQQQEEARRAEERAKAEARFVASQKAKEEVAA